jgi:undecaprenyl-diphosphatase
MIPGMSRSGATIMGAMAVGIDRKTAAEFSFFLALPTLTGATALQLFKHRDALDGGQYGLIAIGAAVSFVVALAVIRLFVGYVSRRGFRASSRGTALSSGAAALIWLAMPLAAHFCHISWNLPRQRRLIVRRRLGRSLRVPRPAPRPAQKGI